MNQSAWEIDVRKRDKEAFKYSFVARPTRQDNLELRRIYAESGECLICGGQLGSCGHSYTRKSPKARTCNACEWHEYCSSCSVEVCGANMMAGNLCPSCYNKNKNSMFEE